MNLLCSLNNPVKYFSTSSSIVTLPIPDLLFTFENNMTNTGSNSVTSGATSASSSIAFSTATRKEGLYSLSLTSNTTSQAIYKYPSTGTYKLNATDGNGNFAGCSFALWFNVSSYSDNGTMIQWYVSNYTTTWLLINFQTSTSALQVRFGNQGFIQSLNSFTPKINLSYWNHLAFTIQANGRWIVMINGVRQTNFDNLQTTNLSSMIATPNTGGDTGILLFGGFGLNAPINFTGYLDGFRVYTTPLSEQQLKLLYVQTNLPDIYNTWDTNATSIGSLGTNNSWVNTTTEVQTNQSYGLVSSDYYMSASTSISARLSSINTQYYRFPSLNTTEGSYLLGSNGITLSF